MGVKIADLVCQKSISFEELKGKTLAVDFSNAVYQFLASIRQPDGTLLVDKEGRVTSHLMGIFTRFSNLLLKGINLVLVFDGEAPKLKHKTREARAELKKLAEAKFCKAKEREDVEQMAKFAKQTGRVNQEMLDESKELLEALGIPVVQARSEAEAQCAFMAKNKDVWACASQDYDALLFGSPRLVRNLTVSARRRLPRGGYIENSPQIIHLKEETERIGINQHQLILIGILTGTDYNPGGIKGIGAKKALEIVKKKGFEKEAERLCKDAGFDLNELFDLFENPALNENYEIRFKEMQKKAVRDILVKKHDFNAERVENMLSKFNESDLKRWF